MKTLGIDLSTDPKKTGIACVQWGRTGATVTNVGHEQDGFELTDEIRAADKTGIDCPFGWPDEFIDYVTSHRDGTVPLPAAPRGVLRYRFTDSEVTRLTGVRGLSVSSDQIGSTAMRVAGLLATLAAHGENADRSGSGKVVEVYPAAALRIWNLPHQGYKAARTDDRSRLVDLLLATASWLQLGSHESACRRSDDVLDAVLCAVIAGFQAADDCFPPPATRLDQVRREGWIALPRISLDRYPSL